MGPILELSVDLPPPGSRDRLRALHRQLQAAILDGRLRPGLRLPATRVLARHLGVSRNTAIAAYDLLMSEGYLVGRRGAGTYVADLPPRRSRPLPATTGPDPRLAAFWRDRPERPSTPGPLAHDFRVGLPDKSQFPFDVWRRLSARVLRSLARREAAYAAPEGQPALRAAIARHVSFARAVACEAEDVLVTGGAQQAFDLLARILVTPGRTVVAVEDPATRRRASPSPRRGRRSSACRSTTRGWWSTASPSVSRWSAPRPRTSSRSASPCRHGGGRRCSASRVPAMPWWSRTTTTPSSASAAGCSTPCRPSTARARCSTSGPSPRACFAHSGPATWWRRPGPGRRWRRRASWPTRMAR